ncbi:uncharacterized protein lrif1 [Anableps anableps]
MDRSSVLYQVMPAVGADGKNIMKLVPVLRNNRQPSLTQPVVQGSNGQAYLTQTPVQIINAQFFPIQTPVQVINGQSYLNTTPQKVITVFNPLLQGASPQFIGSPVSAVNVWSSQMDSSSRSSLNTKSPQQQTVNSEAKIPQTRSPSVGCSVEVPLSEKSPTLCRSEVPNVPNEAQVPSVSVSKHQPVVKDQLLSPSASFSAKCSSPTVIYVSPVTTENPKATQTIGSTAEHLRGLAVMVNTYEESQLFTCDAPPKKGSAPKLKLIPKVSKRPNSPTRWVIEEMGGCTAEDVSITPPSSESASSPSLSSFSKKEDVPKQTLPESPNPWVMYDGRLFYGTKKGGSSSKSPAAPQLLPSSSQQPVKSAGPLTNEVIDLCDDDSSPSSNTAAIYGGEEDNVIFVSYVPPKSKSGSAQKDWLGCESSSSRADVPAGRDRGRLQSTSGSRDVAGPAEVVRTESLNPKGLMGIPDQQLDNLEMDAEMGSLAAPSKEQRAPAVQNSELPVPVGTSSSAAQPCQKSDHQLRSIFGITADIKICLQKIDEMPHWCVSANVLQTKSRGPVDGGEMSRNVFKVREVSLQEFPSPDKLDVKVLTEQSPSSHAISLRSPCVSKENCCNSSEMSFSPGAESVFGYVEPIDEDFPDENDIPQLQDTPAHPQTFVEVNTNTRRMGRTRKRTMCLCCVPPILLPVIKSGTRLEELERWMSTTETASKRGGRTKAARKDGKTSTKVSHLNCRVHKPPASTGSSTGSEGLKRHEQIRRHNEHQANKQHK